MSEKASCAGSKEIKNPYPEDMVCVRCGEITEMWTDETETVCKGCNKTITREMKSSCIEWCPAAKDCVGAEKYERIMKALKQQQQ